MQQRIVVTDLTRFHDDKLCLAGLTEDGQTTIRPLFDSGNGRGEYLTYDTCKAGEILPGSILSGVFSNRSNGTAPHIEDRLYSDLKGEGTCSADEFERILTQSASKSVAEGFGVPTGFAKAIPVTTPPVRSLITIEVDPLTIQFVEDNFKPNRVKIHFRDASGSLYRYIPVNDLGFMDYVGKTETRRLSPAQVTSFLQRQHRVLLRVGVGRVFTAGETTGFWLQVNGIYSFPLYPRELRSY